MSTPLLLASIYKSNTADTVPLIDGNTGSALGGIALFRTATAVLFHVGAVGSLVITQPDGTSRTIDSTAWIQGAWHLVQIAACDPASTILPTDFELGWGLP